MANNGMESLKEDRKAAVEAGLVHFQVISDERDRLKNELASSKVDLAAMKVVVEAQSSQITEMESRVASMQVVRDQAVAERAKYETLFASFQAMLRTFAVPATPLIKGIEDEESTPSPNRAS